MKVKELVEQLQKLDQEKEIWNPDDFYLHIPPHIKEGSELDDDYYFY